MEGLRGHTSGYAVPTFVIDAPGGSSKIPVMPNYLMSYSDHKVVLRNYEGYITTYEEPPTYNRHDGASCSYCQHGQPEPGQSGVLGLLEGERMWIEPKGFGASTRAATPRPTGCRTRRSGSRSGSGRSRARPVPRFASCNPATPPRPSPRRNTVPARSPGHATASRPGRRTGSCSNPRRRATRPTRRRHHRD